MTERKYTLPAGTVLHSPVRDYTVLSVLGQGGFGITYKVSSLINVGNIKVRTVFAVKEFFMKEACERDASNKMVYSTPVSGTVEDGLKGFIKEARRLNEVCKGNRNIVDVNEVFEANGTAYFVMEYLDGGDLRQLVGNSRGISEEKALAIIIPVARALQYIHGKKLLHLDIKPDNIVIRHTPEHGDEPVLIDFGVSVHFDTRGHLTTMHNSAGMSEGYSPIEQYASITKFTPYSDVYALAATLFFLLTGKNPPNAYEMNDAYLESAIPPDVSPTTRQAITHAMKKLHEERTQTMAQFINELTAKDGEAGRQEPDKSTDTKLIKPKPSKIKNGSNTHKSISGKKALRIAFPAIALLIIIGGASWLLGSGKMTKTTPPAKTATTKANTTSTTTAQTTSTTRKEKVDGPKLVEGLRCKVAQGMCTYNGYVNDNNVPNGEGEARFDDGRYYKGKFSKGLMYDDGKAKFRYANGDTYVGSFVNDHFSTGTYTSKSTGQYFIGIFDENGQPKKGAWYGSNGKLQQVL